MEVKKKRYSETLRHGRVWLGKMANSGIWYARFVIPETETQKGPYSLGTTLKKEAIDEAEIISAQLLNRTYGFIDDSIPFAVLADKFFADIVKTGNVNTVKRIKMSVNVFERWMQFHSKGSEAVMNLSEETSTIFRNYRVEVDKVASRTADNDVKNLHQIFRWGMGRKLVSRSPFRYGKKEAGGVRLTSASIHKPISYVTAQFMALTKAAKAIDDELIHDFIVLFGLTGMRYGEGAHLRAVDVIWDKRQPYILIKAREDWAPKDPKEVKKVPLCSEVQCVLRRRSKGRAPGELLFQNTNGIAYANKDARKRLREVVKHAGLVLPSRLKPFHGFRAYFVKTCLLSGMTIPALMQITGHDSVGMVLHYSGMNDDEMFSEFGKFDASVTLNDNYE